MPRFIMPIIGTKSSVEFEPTEDDRETAMQNHHQTLERLAERGGLDWTELDAVLAHEPYYERHREPGNSAKRVMLILTHRAGNSVSAIQNSTKWRKYRDDTEQEGT